MRIIPERVFFATFPPTVCVSCGLPPGECSPASCPTWRLAARYDSERGIWLPTDLDGFVPDGRHESEVS